MVQLEVIAVKNSMFSEHQTFDSSLFRDPSTFGVPFSFGEAIFVDSTYISWVLGLKIKDCKLLLSCWLLFISLPSFSVLNMSAASVKPPKPSLTFSWRNLVSGSNAFSQSEPFPVSTLGSHYKGDWVEPVFLGSVLISAKDLSIASALLTFWWGPPPVLLIAYHVCCC